METFVFIDHWRGAAVFINLITFFFSFAAFCVGLLISKRIKKALDSEVLAGVVHSFLLASGGLSLRALFILLYLIGVFGQAFSVVVADLSMLLVAGGLFNAYLVFERYLRTRK